MISEGRIITSGEVRFREHFKDRFNDYQILRTIYHNDRENVVKKQELPQPFFKQEGYKLAKKTNFS